VVLTTAATVIASQAVISGAFTLVQQAIQLGAVPRLDVRQTSEESAGQVYVVTVRKPHQTAQLSSISHEEIGVYRCVGVWRAGFGGAGGSVGDCWISGGSTRLHGPCAISVLISRKWLQAASVASQSCVPCPRSKHHSCPFEPGPGIPACASMIATPAIVAHMTSPFLALHDRQLVNTVNLR
jgi:hypothetical protein